ncbi:hypothetical protein Ciccas_008686 [Cichlidogyrus casuarinus]|uniref:WW domain-containing protein n=1 Tax=Cichlidogyrus casuarinus TaxID=1844966 RepID=A0ABD2PZA5_9PLAT
MSEQIVLEELRDPTYSPSDIEVFEYASLIGIDPLTESDLLPIARMGLMASLPDNWKPCQTPKGELYYFNFVTGISQWDHPLDEYFQKLVIAERWRRSNFLDPIPSDSEKEKISLHKNIEYSHILPSDYDRDEVDGSESENADSGCSSKAEDPPLPKNNAEKNSSCSFQEAKTSNSVYMQNNRTSGTGSSSNRAKILFYKKTNTPKQLANRITSPTHSNISDFNWNVVYNQGDTESEPIPVPQEPPKNQPTASIQQDLRLLRSRQFIRMNLHETGALSVREVSDVDVDKLKEEDTTSVSSVDCARNIAIIKRPNNPANGSNSNNMKIIHIQGLSGSAFAVERTVRNSLPQEGELLRQKEAEIEALSQQLEELKKQLSTKEKEIDSLKKLLESTSRRKRVESDGNMLEGKLERFGFGYQSLKQPAKRSSNDFGWGSDSSFTLADLQAVRRRPKKKKGARKTRSMVLASSNHYHSPQFSTKADFIALRSNRHLGSNYENPYVA